MCNLYNVAPKEAVERYFRLQLPEQLKVSEPVPPFGWGLFVRASAGGALEALVGQWGLIRPGAPARCEMVGKRPRSTNNARAETMASRPTFKQAWAKGQRCLIPAIWYQEPNWETGKNIWWRLKRADGEPWAIAGLWSEWTDQATGELVPNFTAITVNCDEHPMLKRLHRPDPDLPADAQDKRSLVHIEPEHWDTWLRGGAEAAKALLLPAPVGMFDQADAQRTDEVLQRLATEGTRPAGQ